MTEPDPNEENTPVRHRKRRREVQAEDIVSWIWENDDPAATVCQSRHLDIGDQSLQGSELQVYNGLLACEQEQSNDVHGEASSLDRTLTNILMFADDCRAGVEWLDNEVVSHDDEQARRAGQRRRHLKERGLLRNGNRFVRICGQIITDAGTVAIMAARQCIDSWEETNDHRSLHFHKNEGGIRWQPCSAENGTTTRMHIANPFTAPPATPEADGRTVETYFVSLSDDEPGTAERNRWLSETETDIEDEEQHGTLQWTLNPHGRRALDWLSDAAGTAAVITLDNEEETLRELFPSAREMRRREERALRRKQAAEATKSEPTDAPPSGRGPSVH